MAPKLTFTYDKIGDILYIEKCSPYAEQDSDEIADDIVVRLNPETRAVESFEILFFTKRLASDPVLELPVSGDFRLEPN
jgi:uncharacterized protein YuzE